MARGAVQVLADLRAQGRLDAVVALGGSRRSLARRARDAGTPDGRSEADGVDHGCWGHPPVRRWQRYRDALPGGRYRRAQPGLGTDPRQRGRGHRGHGGCGRPMAAERWRQAAHRCDHVRCHHGLCVIGVQDPGRPRLRGAGIPCERHRWAVDGGAGAFGCRRRCAGRDHHRARGPPGRGRAFRGARPA